MAHALRDPITEEQLRTQLAACYRIFAMLGWTELIYNHITVRIPGPERHFLINPFGLHYREVTASNLVRIDLEGRIVGRSEHPVNPAGFVLHSAIHQHIPEAHCVMHVHTTAGCAVASADAGLCMNNFYSAQLHGRVAYHEFEGITVHADEGPRVIASIGDKPAVILRNHGLLSWGPTLPLAFAYLWTLQRACEIQVAGAALGPARPIAEGIQRKCSADALQFDPRYGGGADGFAALVRQVERLDPSYRD
ncbi:class II aldolase/adducin family protein [Verticiella sediminum]|uniref:Class II aldolase/adducin family protein n=1 Tax=Verticiella sediminum TaxID=1247510 RepID=A0A556AQ90_9BURK|nr:class II aldolase/adducin family protein [Verticiella sediminum]TSH95079.1 class II aldolase/adducin family protein [Verticiella sediminum]